MKYNMKEERGYTVIEMVGDVDLSCSPDARKQILDCLNANASVLVDLSQVTYIDSSGIACLVEGFQTAKKKELNFGLIQVSEAAMNVLHLARLDEVFLIHNSVEDRVKADTG